MIKDSAKIKNILVVSLTNIGDVVLTFPVIDVLKQDFPQAKLSVIIGPKGAPLLAHNSMIHKIYIYDKKVSFYKTVAWFLNLRKEKFDLIIDLRNTALPFFLFAHQRTSPFLKRNFQEHMRLQHLKRLASIYPYQREAAHRFALNLDQRDKKYIHDLLTPHLGPDPLYVVVSPGAADDAKRWSEEGFAKVCEQISERYFLKIVLAGDEKDRIVGEKIAAKMKIQPLNLCGKTSLAQLACLLQRSQWALVNDSGIMHLASYLDVPVIALFGPTDPHRYGPWSSQSQVIEKRSSCEEKNVPIREWIHAIEPKDVLTAVEDLMRQKNFVSNHEKKLF